jgi:hypothetical protein
VQHRRLGDVVQQRLVHTAVALCLRSSGLVLETSSLTFREEGGLALLLTLDYE